MARNKSKSRKAKGTPGTSQANLPNPTAKNKKKKKKAKKKHQGLPPIIEQVGKFFNQQTNDELRNLMKTYIGESMPGNAFCRNYLKGYSLSDEQIIDAMQSPNGRHLLEGPNKPAFERLADKIRFALAAENRNKKGNLKEIPNNQNGFDNFSNDVFGLLANMRNDLVGIEQEKTLKLPISINQTSRFSRIPRQNNSTQQPSTSSAPIVNDDDDIIEDTTPMEGELLEPQEVDISKRYSMLQFRRDELRRYNPNDVPVSDCDQSGSEDETDCFNTYFARRCKNFEEQRKAEIIRNRPFGVGRRNNFKMNTSRQSNGSFQFRR